MHELHEWACTVVGDLLDGFDGDPAASMLGLLAFGYGQPVPVLLGSRWSEFDLPSCIWRVQGQTLPLTAPFLVLLERYRRVCPDPVDHMFPGQGGGVLGKVQANARVLEVLREFFDLDDLRAVAVRLCPDLRGAEWRAECLRQYADLGATCEQVGALEQELDRRLRSLVEGWHLALCLAKVMEARGLPR
ncbi:hypothetical protein DM872_27405 [Pseudomonas taiwanensis]|uniref:hypothetical protein n=1 Tax=Pseudomonas taiwanensis TaxID=470150 RepID=UPI0015B7972A|nr:hypothetical protein [Pseudomonas taiwanensis]NWL80584.1 hypothetical protein [Pseudomonas taiwanensis]